MCRLCIPDISKEKIKNAQKVLANTNVANTIKKLPDFHDKAFANINCLSCANCCKNHSPTFKPSDIKRIAQYLKIKEADFINTYLKTDEDEDFVLQKSPCHFLMEDNTCIIYEVRPNDCRRYPYTDIDIFVKKQKLTLKNLEVCPAVEKVIDFIKTNK